VSGKKSEVSLTPSFTYEINHPSFSLTLNSGKNDLKEAVLKFKHYLMGNFL
jgi:hypothetical protein